MGFVVVEATYGIIAGSMALLADAGHNLSDVLGLLIAWGAATLARRRPIARYTYGLRSSSILAAFLNALLLLVAIALIAFGPIRRFAEPAPVAGGTVMAVAAIGILVNGITAGCSCRAARATWTAGARSSTWRQKRRCRGTSWFPGSSSPEPAGLGSTPV